MTDTSREAVIQNLEWQAVVNRDAYRSVCYNPALTEVLNRAIAMLEVDKREIEAMERQVEILSDELSKFSKQAQAVEPVAWVFLPNRELLWPAEVEATNPIAIDDYKPLYAHPDQMQAYGKACAAAERERLLRIVYEQATPLGTSGECIWISVKSQVRHVPKTDWSAA